jgi:RNA polymerase sigma factor (sigma-70 family)
MSSAVLDNLLNRLNEGDVAAAELVYQEYQPYLRMLISRRLRPALRAKFDTMDVVQSVWADLLAGIRRAGWQFPDRAHLQAFLVRLARNRFLDYCRKHRHAVAREVPLSPDSPATDVACDQPRPSEVARRDELWDRMLALSPRNHHELLRLKSQGMTFAEIGARTGFHPSSVRRIIHDLAVRVAAAEKGTDARPTSGLD